MKRKRIFMRFLRSLGPKGRFACKEFPKSLRFYNFFLVTLPSMMANLLHLGKKRNTFLCFALDFS